MILDKISNSGRIEALHPGLKTLFDYIKSHDLNALPMGRTELDGNRVFINRAEPELLPREKQAIEVHRAYIDVHIPLDRTETIGWKSLADLGTPRAPFDTDADFALYDEAAESYVDVHPGEFLIVFPEDGHAPIIGQGILQKAIAKIHV